MSVPTRAASPPGSGSAQALTSPRSRPDRAPPGLRTAGRLCHLEGSVPGPSCPALSRNCPLSSPVTSALVPASPWTSVSLVAFSAGRTGTGEMGTADQQLVPHPSRLAGTLAAPPAPRASLPLPHWVSGGRSCYPLSDYLFIVVLVPTSAGEDGPLGEPEYVGSPGPFAGRLADGRSSPECGPCVARSSCFSEETRNLEFSVKSPIFKYWQLIQVFLKQCASHTKRPPPSKNREAVSPPHLDLTTPEGSSHSSLLFFFLGIPSNTSVTELLVVLNK